MEKMRMIGVVTLYNSHKEQVLHNIMQYAPYLDKLIVWDNSANSHKDWSLNTSVTYHWTGENSCIAPAINYVFDDAKANGFQTILLMDEDSTWEDFPSYRNDIERIMSEGRDMVFTPYVKGCDHFDISKDEQEKRLFINSGTVIPTKILTAIGGIDEKAFPLDALDHDIAFRLIKHGFKVCCLTKHKLNHSLGYPQQMGPFHMFTPNYNRQRTYSMTRSHIICYRKHQAFMTGEDKDYLFNEIIRRKFFRILFAEPDKLGRLTAFVKGIVSGLSYNLRKESLL